MGKRIKIRIGISKKLRFTVYKRDRYICGYCGNRKKPSSLVVDHIIPIKPWGGKTILKNLVTACSPCNGHKKHNLPGEHSSPKLKWHAGKRVAKITLLSQILRSVLREPKIAYRR